MVQVTRFIQPPALEAVPYAAITCPTANSRMNPRRMTVSGTYDTANCMGLKLEVEYIDSTGMSISTVEYNNITTDGEFWDQVIAAPDNAVSCNITIYCGDVAQDKIQGVNFIRAMVASNSAVSMAANAAPQVFKAANVNNNLTLTINNPAASSGNDCDTVVVIKHTGHLQALAILPHYHTPHPGAAKRVLTYHQLSPGRYSSKLVYIDEKDVAIYDGERIKIS